MYGLHAKDGEREIDWGKTAVDYQAHRPGPPASFYERLRLLGVGQVGQQILDLGTGTGVLALQFARQGAHVVGVDIAAEQISMARQGAREEGLDAEFLVHPAEQLPWQEPRFDVVTANQCWLYFDKAKVITALRRVLRPGGVLVTSHFCWLPRLDDVARGSEQLVLQFNSDWTGADWSGEIPAQPRWARADFDVPAMFYYDEAIPFTHASWRGRIRACRGVGATLSAEEVAAFDRAHQAWLQETVPESFSILHRIDAHLFRFRSTTDGETP